MQNSVFKSERRALTAGDSSWVAQYHEIRKTTESARLQEWLKRLDFISMVTAIADVPSALPDLTEICLYRDWIDAADQENPHLFVAWFNLGTVYARAGDVKAAMEAYRKASSRNPTFTPAAINLGLMLESAGQTDAALKIWDEALQRTEARKALLNHKGRLLEQLGRLEDAEDVLRISLLTDPDQPDAIQHWLHVRQKTCCWPIATNELTGLSAKQLLHHSGPLALLALTDDIAQQRAVAKAWIERKLPAAPLRLSPSQGYRHDRVRIGYLSSDFCRHAMSYLITELFERHDRSRFEVFGYCSTHDDDSDIRRRVLAAFDHVRPIRDLSDEAAARLICSDEIDVLIDLNGLTAHTRLAVLRWRPAPVQATWLGFIGPVPLPELDYLFCDDFVVPADRAAGYQPKPLPIAQVYQPNDTKRAIGNTVTRTEAGLPDNKFVFCCFSNHYKITETMFAAWMSILDQVPNSVLWLTDDNVWSRSNLQLAATRAGINPERLLFAAKASPESYMNRLALADLFLDTFPYNAGTVASDAIRMGVPLVTLCGDAFAARMAGSLLHALGADSGVATKVTDYIARAVNLASDPDEYTSFKQHFGIERWTATLGDIGSFTATFEAALVQIVRKNPEDSDMPLEVVAAAEQATPEGAVAIYDQWLLDHPIHPLTHLIWYNRGASLDAAGQTAMAAESFKRAITDMPDFLPAWINAGLILEKLGRIDEALFHWQSAADRTVPASSDATGCKITAFRQMARLLRSFGRVADAETVLRRCLAMDPTQRDVLQHLIAVREMRCDWPILAPVCGLTNSAVMAALSPLALLIHTNDPIYQLAHAGLSFVHDMATYTGPRTAGRWPPPEPRPLRTRPMRIGYVSGDLREHAIGFLAPEVFELHDRGKFEVFAYYTGVPAEDRQKDRIRRAADRWTNIAGWDARAVAARIVSDEIDILIDLAGHTNGAPVAALSLRPAPVIVNWLGYPGTMGTPHHDYIIADPIVIPHSYEKYYSERVVRLPCYQPNDRARVVAPIPSRHDVGLPEDAVVYCSFNGTQKITPLMFARWMAILRRVPNSVLWMLSCDAETDQRLTCRAAALGISPERLVFAARLPNAEHLARFPLADVFLDTFPYGAHTTASDALWMGLPVITIAGHTFASRVCASLVSAAGLGELVCDHPDAYEELAVALGQDHQRRLASRNRLQLNRDGSVLFDTPLLVARLEGLYEAMWDAYLNGSIPEPDTTNFPVYNEIGNEVDHETDGSYDLQTYEQHYTDALYRRDCVAPLPIDGRLWTEAASSVRRAAPARCSHPQGVEFLNIMRQSSGSDLVGLVADVLTASILKNDIDADSGFYAIEGMSGKKYRYFINTLVRGVRSPRYLEVGSWAGSTLCAAIHDNRIDAVAIDNWSEFGGPKQAFMENVARFKTDNANVLFVEGDFRQVDFRKLGQRNIYLYDGPHEEQDQYDGLAQAIDCLDDQFVFIVDDWNWERVRNGTFAAIQDHRLRILFSAEIRTTLDSRNPPVWFRQSDWHNGYFISVLEKTHSRKPGNDTNVDEPTTSVPLSAPDAGSSCSRVTRPDVPAGRQEILDQILRSRSAGVASLLHVGCGGPDPQKLPIFFRQPGWREIRLDIDPGVRPDIISSITDMPTVPDGELDAVYSSHNIEHLYHHEVAPALHEFRRVLKTNGFLLVTTPDLQAVATHMADGKLEDALYHSPMGPIAAMDILFGHRKSVAAGNRFMAHRSGFTGDTLGAALIHAGFSAAVVRRLPSTFGLAAVAFVAPPTDSLLQAARVLILPAPELVAVLYTRNTVSGHDAPT